MYNGDQREDEIISALERGIEGGAELSVVV